MSTERTEFQVGAENKIDVKVECNSCGQKYELRPVLNYGEGIDAIRLYRLFHYVPCCGACGSDNITLGIPNPYRKPTMTPELRQFARNMGIGLIGE